MDGTVMVWPTCMGGMAICYVWYAGSITPITDLSAGPVGDGHHFDAVRSAEQRESPLGRGHTQLQALVGDLRRTGQLPPHVRPVNLTGTETHSYIVTQYTYIQLCIMSYRSCICTDGYLYIYIAVRAQIDECLIDECIERSSKNSSREHVRLQLI